MKKKNIYYISKKGKELFDIKVMIYLPTFSKAKNSDINIYEPLLGSVVLKEFISMKPYLVRMTTL